MTRLSRSLAATKGARVPRPRSNPSSMKYTAQRIPHSRNQICCSSRMALYLTFLLFRGGQGRRTLDGKLANEIETDHPEHRVDDNKSRHGDPPLGIGRQ